VSQEPHKALAHLVSKFPEDSWKDPRWLEFALRDLCWESPREVSALILVSREQLPEQLQADLGGTPLEALLPRHAARLISRLAIAEHLIHWSVEAWAAALGAAVTPRDPRAPVAAAPAVAAPVAPVAAPPAPAFAPSAPAFAPPAPVAAPPMSAGPAAPSVDPRYQLSADEERKIAEARAAEMKRLGRAEEPAAATSAGTPEPPPVSKGPELPSDPPGWITWWQLKMQGHRQRWGDGAMLEAKLLDNHHAFVVSTAGVTQINLLDGSRVWTLDTPLTTATLNPLGTTLALAIPGQGLVLGPLDGAGAPMVLGGHTTPISALAFSRDGQLVASGDINTILLWDVRTGQVRHTLRGHGGRINALSFSPDGRLLASCSADGTGRLWDVGTGRPWYTLEGVPSQPTRIQFSPDGRLVTMAHQDRALSVWEVRSGKALGQLLGHAGAVTSVSFAPNGAKMLSGGSDGTICLWDTAKGQGLAALRPHALPVWAVSFSPDGTRFLSASEDNTLRLWDADTGRPLQVAAWNALKILAVSPDAAQVAYRAPDQSLAFWDLAAAKQLRSLVSQSPPLCALFHDGGQLLLTGHEDGTAQAWDATASKQLVRMVGHHGAITALAVSHDGQLAGTGSVDNALRIWEVRDGQEWRLLLGHIGAVTSISFSPDDRVLASGSRDGTVRLWEVGTGRIWMSMPDHRAPIQCVRFSPDGRHLVSAGGTTTHLWIPGNAKPRLTLRGHAGPVTSAAFSPDGRVVVTASQDNTARIWNTETGGSFTSWWPAPPGWSRSPSGTTRCSPSAPVSCGPGALPPLADLESPSRNHATAPQHRSELHHGTLPAPLPGRPFPRRRRPGRGLQGHHGQLDGGPQVVLRKTGHPRAAPGAPEARGAGPPDPPVSSGPSTSSRTPRCPATAT
jgi:WD40 repeat protein